MPTSKAPRSEAAANIPPQRCRLCAARRVCQIGQLPPNHQERLEPLIHEVDFAKGERLQEQGAGMEVLRAIKLGTVMLSRRGPDGVDRPVGLFGRGHLLDHVGLLEQTTVASAQAMSPGRLCELPMAAWRANSLADPVFLTAVHASMTRSWARLADWGQVMRLRGLRRQLVNTLLLLGEEQGSQTVRLPTHVALAALLGTSRESVARTLRSLALDGHLRRVDRWHAELGSSHTVVFQDEQTEDR